MRVHRLPKYPSPIQRDWIYPLYISHALLFFKIFTSAIFYEVIIIRDNYNNDSNEL